MRGNRWLVGGLLVAALALVCCLGLVAGVAVTRGSQGAPARGTSPEDLPARPDESILQPVQPTSVPTLAAIEPVGQPAGAGFQALAEYARVIRPILDQALPLAERDGHILQEADENPAALCAAPGLPQPVLVADAGQMATLVEQLTAITPPEEAERLVHRPLTESARLWAEALENINRSCQTATQVEQDLLRLGAMLQLGGSLLNFRIASDNFWRLALVNGLEAIVGPEP